MNSDIELAKVAPTLLQAISLSLPTIAIFIVLGGGKGGQEAYEKTAFKISLGALLSVVLAATITVVYLMIYRMDWVIYTATISYMIGMLLLAISTAHLLVGRWLKGA